MMSHWPIELGLQMWLATYRRTRMSDVRRTVAIVFGENLGHPQRHEPQRLQHAYRPCGQRPQAPRYRPPRAVFQ